MAELRAGAAYPLIKRGGPGGAWCKVDVQGTPGWVECAVARPAEPTAEGPASAPPSSAPRRPPGARCASTCPGPQLFPDPVHLGAAERAVLAMCPARPDAAVPASEVKRFFGAHYDDPRLQRALSAAGRPGSGAGVRESNLDWLTGLWVSTGPRNAFTHVFCGDDWDEAKLGGLHWLPRFVELEAQGKICFGGPARGDRPKVGAQYLVRYTGLAPWSCGTKPIGGFLDSTDPVALAATATRAFVRCCDRARGRREGGVYSAPDLGGARFRIWCGTRNGTYGIATIHPTDEGATCAE